MRWGWVLLASGLILALALGGFAVGTGSDAIRQDRRSLRRDIGWDEAYEFMRKHEVVGLKLTETEKRGGRAWKVIAGIDEQYNDKWVNAHWLEAQIVEKLDRNNPLRLAFLDKLKRFYYDNYWITSGAHALPSPANVVRFDAYVNMGVIYNVDDVNIALAKRYDKYLSNPRVDKYPGWLIRVTDLNNFIREG